jgi:hypothetical protein
VINHYLNSNFKNQFIIRGKKKLVELLIKTTTLLSLRDSSIGWKPRFMKRNSLVEILHHLLGRLKKEKKKI